MLMSREMYRQFDGTNAKEIYKWMEVVPTEQDQDNCIFIRKIDGVVLVGIGDYIVKKDNGHVGYNKIGFEGIFI